MKQIDISGSRAAFLVSAGMWFFAYFVHTVFWLALAGLVFSALIISTHAGRFNILLKLTGLHDFRNHLMLYSFSGLFLGFLLGMFYRLTYQMPLVPINFTIAAFTAPAVGMTEELVFRGFIQGTVTNSQSWKSIIFSSGSHTLYKFLVIWSYPGVLGIDLLILVLLTFAAGIVVGWLRKKSGNIIPCALAHGCFDIMIYGSLSILPVWVWR
jgi:membrane protease YdiL (CAAX protease family)